MRLPLWGVLKVDLELIKWRWSDLCPFASTSTLVCPPIPQNCPSLSSTPPQTVDISWLLPRMVGTALASVLYIADHPLPSDCHRPNVIITIASLIVVVVVVTAATINDHVTFIVVAIVSAILVVVVWTSSKNFVTVATETSNWTWSEDAVDAMSHRSWSALRERS